MWHASGTAGEADRGSVQDGASRARAYNPCRSLRRARNRNAVNHSCSAGPRSGRHCCRCASVGLERCCAGAGGWSKLAVAYMLAYRARHHPAAGGCRGVVRGHKPRCPPPLVLVLAQAAVAHGWTGRAVAMVAARLAGLVTLGGMVLLAPRWMVSNDSVISTLSAEPYARAVSDARTAVLQVVGGLLLAAGAVATWRQVRISREGQITERFTRAVDQFDSDKRDVRLGGIYGLERVAHDSQPDRATIAAVLSAFVRGTPPGRLGRTWGRLHRFRRTPRTRNPHRSWSACPTSMRQSTPSAVCG